jgi:hypothetical protein
MGFHIKQNTYSVLVGQASMLARSGLNVAEGVFVESKTHDPFEPLRLAGLGF